MNANTPTPWRKKMFHNGGDRDNRRTFIGADGQGFAHTCGLSEEVDKANADLIVRAVNNFQPMLDALRYYRDKAISAHPAEFIGVEEAKQFEKLVLAALESAEKE